MVYFFKSLLGKDRRWIGYSRTLDISNSSYLEWCGSLTSNSRYLEPFLHGSLAVSFLATFTYLVSNYLATTFIIDISNSNDICGSLTSNSRYLEPFLHGSVTVSCLATFKCLVSNYLATTFVFWSLREIHVFILWSKD